MCSYERKFIHKSLKAALKHAVKEGKSLATSDDVIDARLWSVYFATTQGPSYDHKTSSVVTEGNVTKLVERLQRETKKVEIEEKTNARAKTEEWEERKVELKAYKPMSLNPVEERIAEVFKTYININSVLQDLYGMENISIRCPNCHRANSSHTPYIKTKYFKSGNLAPAVEGGSSEQPEPATTISYPSPPAEKSATKAKKSVVKTEKSTAKKNPHTSQGEGAIPQSTSKQAHEGAGVTTRSTSKQACASVNEDESAPASATSATASAKAPPPASAKSGQRGKQRKK